jgi:6-pyruvoyltetrahydropterin/6-carboxytetrahydropterin synthase
MWKISKSFDLSYCHRLHNQAVDSGYSCDAKNKCRQLHGHNGEVVINLSSKILDDKGMITDFSDMKYFTKTIKDNIDHKSILYIKDPMIPLLFNGKLIDPKLKKEKERLGSETNNPNLVHQDVLIPYWFNIETEMKAYVYNGTTPNLYYGSEEITGYSKDLLDEYFNSFLFVDFIPTAENLAKWIFDYINDDMKVEGIWNPDISVDSIEWKETPTSSAIYSRE